MRLGAMLRDVWDGLWRKPATEKYPFQRRPAPARLRGVLHFEPSKCTGCGMCAQDCPARALELVTLDKKNKRFVLRYHLDRCTYCAQCVASCKFRCLDMSNAEWELAARGKQAFTVDYGNAADVEQWLERLAAGKSPSAA